MRVKCKLWQQQQRAAAKRRPWPRLEERGALEDGLARPCGSGDGPLAPVRGAAGRCELGAGF